MEDLSEEQVADHMNKWKAYMGGLAQNGNLVGGLPLQAGGRVVTADGAKEDIVKSAAGEVISGWLHYKTEDMDAACELVKGCPIFEHNGNLEVREVLPMEM
ncbi:MAG: hypothetical protein HRT71_02235 [Flavobacteriales bacterium]|nr:hypothetical protein [Flavobacteriales bacterium]